MAGPGQLSGLWARQGYGLGWALKYVESTGCHMLSYTDKYINELRETNLKSSIFNIIVFDRLGRQGFTIFTMNGWGLGRLSLNKTRPD